MGQLVSKADTRSEVRPVDVRAVVSCAARAVTQLGGGTCQRNSTRCVVVRVGCVGVKEDHIVVVFSERSLNIHTNAQVEGQLGRKLDIVLEVRGQVPVAQFQFLRVDAISRVNNAEEEAGKRAAVAVELCNLCLVAWIISLNEKLCAG